MESYHFRPTGHPRIRTNPGPVMVPTHKVGSKQLEVDGPIHIPPGRPTSEGVRRGSRSGCVWVVPGFQMSDDQWGWPNLGRFGGKCR